MKNISADAGFTIFELLVTLGLFIILSGIAVSNLKDLDDPLQDGAAQVLSFVKKVRAHAISTTQAYFVSASSTTQIVTQYGTNCNDVAPVDDPLLVLDLPSTVGMTDIVWSFCFNSRGLADSNIVIPLEDSDGYAKTIEVLLGGAARIQ